MGKKINTTKISLRFYGTISILAGCTLLVGLFIIPIILLRLLLTDVRKDYSFTE